MTPEEALQHDFAGAIRSFRYLAKKYQEGLAADDPQRDEKIATIQRHLATLEKIQKQMGAPHE